MMEIDVAIVQTRPLLLWQSQKYYKLYISFRNVTQKSTCAEIAMVQCNHSFRKGKGHWPKTLVAPVGQNALLSVDNAPISSRENFSSRISTSEEKLQIYDNNTKQLLSLQQASSLVLRAQVSGSLGRIIIILLHIREPIMDEYMCMFTKEGKGPSVIPSSPLLATSMISINS